MLKISSLCVDFPHFSLKDIDLDVESGDYFMLVGPTGSGKTIFLETLAGLHKVNSGKMQLADTDITLLEPEKRNIGMVYQDCALFPHLSVAENIVFGLKIRRISESVVKQKLNELISLLEIVHLVERKPERLSGGEKQKVALARALAINPSMLLLDEPLSALDPETRENIQTELKRIHDELNVTIIHVTHNFDEAMLLGQHIAVIGEGKIKQVGTPEEIFYKPNSEFVARFTGMKNILPGEIVRRTNKSSVFRSGNLEIVTSSYKERAQYACIRPDDVSLSAEDTVGIYENSYHGVISKIEDKGMAVQIKVYLPPEIFCLITRHTYNDMGLSPGKHVIINFKSDSVHLF